MYLSVEHLGSDAELAALITKLSPGVHVDSCRRFHPESTPGEASTATCLSIVLTDEAGEAAAGAIERRCALPWAVPTIVIDARYDPERRPRYLQAGVLEYFDLRTVNIDDLKRTIDIAARVQGVSTRRHREMERFNQLCDTMQVGTWEWDLRENSFVWSLRQFELFGIDAALPRLVYDSWRDIIDPRDRERVEAELGRAIVGQADYHAVFRIRKAAAAGVPEQRWIEGVGRVQRDTRGGAVRMYGLSWDVTSQYQALSDPGARPGCKNCLSHESGNTFQTYFEQSIDCLFYLTEAADGRLIYQAINRSGLKHAGLTLDQVLGRTPSDILGTEVGGIIEDAMRTAIRTGTPYLYKPTFEMGGTSVSYDASYIPISDGEGNVVGVLGSARDITATRRMEESLVRAQKMEALGQIASGTAHDFNNLLQSLTSALDIFEHVEAHVARQEAARIARSAVKSGQALTSSLLSFARREVLQTSPASLHQMIADTREMVRLTLGAKIALRIDAEPALWPVLVSEQQIELAIINLAVNARDAMPDGGVLTITACNVDAADAAVGVLPGRFVRLSIADTGIGMAPEVLARATEPFYTTKSAGKGTGLGLNMVRTTVESMGGVLCIESVLGQGTTVSIYLARAQNSAVTAYRPAALLREA